MIAQRVGLAALRRGAVRPNAFNSQAVCRAVAASALTQTRPIATTKLSTSEGHEILVAQRKNRPVSPHLSIYKMEQTWFGASAWTRITGCTLSGAAYVYFATYLVAPLLGLHIESASLVSAFAAMPLALKGGIKLALGFPFAFHAINGVRHLSYDLVKGFSKKTIQTGERVIFATAAVLAGYLAFGI